MEAETGQTGGYDFIAGNIYFTVFYPYKTNGNS
jgi:hypothetical protein